MLYIIVLQCIIRKKANPGSYWKSKEHKLSAVLKCLRINHCYRTAKFWLSTSLGMIVLENQVVKVNTSSVYKIYTVQTVFLCWSLSLPLWQPEWGDPPALLSTSKWTLQRPWKWARRTIAWVSLDIGRTRTMLCVTGKQQNTFIIHTNGNYLKCVNRKNKLMNIKT